MGKLEFPLGITEPLIGEKDFQTSASVSLQSQTKNRPFIEKYLPLPNFRVFSEPYRIVFLR